MIISHKHKFIFIKTRKTAGTSLEVYLSQYCGDDDIITPFTMSKAELENKESHRPRNFEGFQAHIGAGKVKGKVSEEVWKTYFKFAFDRNPWDLIVSFFLQKSVVRNPDLRIEGTFDEFVHGGADGTYKFPINFNMYSMKGEVVMDFVGRFETLEKDFKYVCDRVGIPYEENRLSHERGKFREKKRKYFFFKKEKKDFRTYYTEETRKIVEKAFEEPINLLDYSFESNYQKE